MVLVGDDFQGRLVRWVIFHHLIDDTLNWIMALPSAHRYEREPLFSVRV
jgi:hypothetical protein